MRALRPAAVTPRRRTAAAVCAALGALAVSTACGSSSSGSSTPNTAGNATAVPGDVPKLGQGSGGGITVTNTTVVRSGTKLTISARIHNDQTVTDELVAAGSQVSATLTLTPALRIPPGGTITIGNGSANAVVLTQNSRLEPDGTIVLNLQFGKAGAVQVFSSFHDASSQS